MAKKMVEEVEEISQANEEVKTEDKKKKISKKDKQKTMSDEEKLLEKLMRLNKKKKVKKDENNTKIKRIDTDINKGLTQEQIKQRINDGLFNAVEKGNTKSIKKILITNIFTFFNILMLCIAAWLISIGALKDLFFLVIVSLNIVIGIVQEIRAKITIDKLSILSTPTAIVLREGNISEIDVKGIVLDDIMILESGKQISSDSIVVEGTIEVNESLLTGESDAIQKNVGDILYSGSYVVSGTCKAKVDAVGGNNYIEKLTTQAKQYNKPKSDLLISLNLIIRFMAIIIVPLGALLFCMQYEELIGNTSYYDSVRKTAGAMIGMIPSGLYLLTSIALAVGVMKLAQNKVLVQELYCIEMLARVDCLCLDKTGTITDGTMTVKNVVEYQPIGGMSTKNIVSALLNATNDQNMTAIALENKFGRGKRLKTIDAIPFSSQRKFSAASFDGYGTFVLGAPEFVLTKNYNSIAHDVLSGAKQGYRVLLVAHTTENIVNANIDTDKLSPVSLIYIEDTIRAEAIDTINYFKTTGVEVKVISGDNPVTVSKVSERAGIEKASDYISLEGLSDIEVIRAATKYTVFGRVSPAQKKLLITTLKEAGKTVAMTGDGVNDILALKEADCSISVASGSEAARNVSHLVLLDNNFSSMPKVVAEGRRVINNVAKVSKLFLTKTIFSLLLAIYAINSGGNYPISTNQLLLIDLFCIGLPSFVLILEPSNVKSKGKFLANIIKGALPGGIVILFNAMVVLGLSGILSLDKRDTSTLIVIIATFTCLIVLYQTCKPFNLYKRLLFAVCSVLSLFVLSVLPKFLDLTPISTIGTYYDDDLVFESISDVPSIEVSEAGYLVIEGMYTEYISNTTNAENSNGYLKVGNHVTDHKITVKTSQNLTYDPDTKDYVLSDTIYLGLGGKVTNISYGTGFDIQISYLGDVYINGINIKYNILPSVTLSKTGNYVVNNVETDIKAEVNRINSILMKDYQIYINNNPTEIFVSPINMGIQSSSGYIVVDCDKTDILYSTELLDDIEVNYALEYVYNDEIIKDTNGVNSLKYDVDLKISQEDYYIINDEYTEFKHTGSESSFEVSYDEDGYLIINDTKTNHLLNIKTTKGGEVGVLSLPAILLTFGLCAITAPFMKFLKCLIPWIKQFIEAIQKFLNKGNNESK